MLLEKSGILDFYAHDNKKFIHGRSEQLTSLAVVQRNFGQMLRLIPWFIDLSAHYIGPISDSGTEKMAICQVPSAFAGQPPLNIESNFVIGVCAG